MTLAERIFKLADNRDPESLACRLRQDRLREFTALLPEDGRAIRILDAGGTPEFWGRHRAQLPSETEITVLNLAFDGQCDLPGISRIRGDARDMSMFRDGEFDFCFSNSVIEHAGTFQDQLRMAGEIRRVAKGYFVQTPNEYFPLEPHFLVFGWQFAPVGLRASLLQRGDRGWMKRVEDPALAREVVQSIRLLSARKLRKMFPDGEIYRERIGGLTKSIVAWRPMS